MTTPKLSMDSVFGRLYRQPDININVGLNAEEMWKLVCDGTLAPSITNVLDVANKPFLKKWAAKLAAQAAVDVANKHPDDVRSRAQTAAKWAAMASDRAADRAANLGDVVHNICEQRALGDTPNVPPDAVPYVESWERWVSDYQPEFLRVETTTYGNVDIPETNGYAGTGDVFVRVGGMVLAGDYKTGRNVYDSAAQQLAALANATHIVSNTGDSLEPNFVVVGGIVIHLTPTGYNIRAVDTSMMAPAWKAFTAYRHAWTYHAKLLAARNPILLSGSVKFADLDTFFKYDREENNNGL